MKAIDSVEPEKQQASLPFVWVPLRGRYAITQMLDTVAQRKPRKRSGGVHVTVGICPVPRVGMVQCRYWQCLWDPLFFGWWENLAEIPTTMVVGGGQEFPNIRFL